MTEKAALSVKNVPMRQVITSFMGLRAHEAGEDFVLGESAEGLLRRRGASRARASPVTPAIGEYLAGLIGEKLGLEDKTGFRPHPEGRAPSGGHEPEERAEKIAENPAYGNIICRCEEVSEGEILDAIHGILGARTLDGVKRRTRAGMGRCQAGFCSPPGDGPAVPGAKHGPDPGAEKRRRFGNLDRAGKDPGLRGGGIP